MIKLLALFVVCGIGAYASDQLVAREEPRALERPTNSELSMRRLRNSINGHQRMQDLFKEMFSGVWENSFDNFPEPSSGTSDLMSKFFGRYKPWWKGEHVCVSEEEKEEDDDSGMVGMTMSSSTQCYSTDKIHRCIIKVGKDGKVKVTTITHQCCHGFERDDGETGCTKAAELESLDKTIREMNLTVFADTIEKLGLKNTLDSGNYTLFVPTDEAMKAENPEMTTIVTDMSNEEEFLKRILKNHVVEGWKGGADMVDEQTLPSLDGGKPLRTNIYRYPAPFMTVNCAKVKSLDNKATNGLVHVVDRVLMPVDMTTWEYLRMDNSLSDFASVVPADVAEKLKDPEAHLTAFVFSNDAFAKLSAATRTAIKNKEGCFKNLIAHHLVDFTICSSAIQSSLSAKSLASGSNRRSLLNLTRSETGQAVYVDGAVLTKTDRVTKNGVIHVIDKVLVDETMMKPLSVASTKGGEAFVDLAESSGVVGAIKEIPEVTIFVPPGDQLIEASESLSPEQTKSLVKSHVFEGLHPITFRTRKATLKDLNGKERTLTSEPRLLFTGQPGITAKTTLQCSSVVRGNVETCGGVLHFVDKPIQTPTRNLYELIKSNANYSQFLMLVEAADLEAELKKEDLEATVLIPTDQAFESHMDMVKKLLDDKSQLKEFVKGHLLTAELCCNEMGGTHWFRNLYRTHASHRVSGYVMGTSNRIGSAAVTQCDVIATNGIAHVISEPLKVPQRRSRGHNRRRWWE